MQQSRQTRNTQLPRRALGPINTLPPTNMDVQKGPFQEESSPYMLAGGRVNLRSPLGDLYQKNEAQHGKTERLPETLTLLSTVLFQASLGVALWTSENFARRKECAQRTATRFCFPATLPLGLFLCLKAVGFAGHIAESKPKVMSPLSYRKGFDQIWGIPQNTVDGPNPAPPKKL